MKHIKLINQKSNYNLPLTAAPCGWFNLCFFGDWDDGCAKTDFCVKDGTAPEESQVR